MAVGKAVTYLLAIDAGNTKTIALVAAADGRILGAERAGCGDIYGAVSPDAALAAIDMAAKGALRRASVAVDSLAGVALSAAGADWPSDFTFLRESLSERGLAHNLLIVNDAIGALCAGSPDGAGVVIAVGTGVATGARSTAGHTWHSGFWQRTHGAYDLSNKALDAVYRAELGLTAQTALAREALAHFDVPDVETLLYRLTSYGSTHSRADIATFAARLLSVAEDGDPVARQLVLKQGAALGRYVDVAARKVGISDNVYNLVLTGGVLRHPSTLLGDAIIKSARESAPQVRPIRSQLEPVAGVVLLALAEAGIDINGAIMQRLTDSLPSAQFYDT